MVNDIEGAYDLGLGVHHCDLGCAVTCVEVLIVVGQAPTFFDFRRHGESPEQFELISRRILEESSLLVGHLEDVVANSGAALSEVLFGKRLVAD